VLLPVSSEFSSHVDGPIKEVRLRTHRLGLAKRYLSDRPTPRRSTIPAVAQIYFSQWAVGKQKRTTRAQPYVYVNGPQVVGSGKINSPSLFMGTTFSLPRRLGRDRGLQADI
jgi:hypothetical protein